MDISGIEGRQFWISLYSIVVPTYEAIRKWFQAFVRKREYQSPGRFASYHQFSAENPVGCALPSITYDIHLLFSTQRAIGPASWVPKDIVV